MTSKPPYYRIYLLTVWQERGRDPPEQTSWRFRLEDPRAGKQQVFANLESLLTALQKFIVSGQEVEPSRRQEDP